MQGRSNSRLDNYVYIYLDNRKPGRWEYKGLIFQYQPFYVGRGVDGRIKDHLSAKERFSGTLKGNVINRIYEDLNETPIYYKIYENLTFNESDKIETDIIAYFGRRNNGTGILTNLTDGGIGPLGIIIKKESRERQSKKKAGQFTSKSKRINQLTLDGKIVKTWDSLYMIEHGTDLTVSMTDVISKRCKLNDLKPYKGYIWEYEGTSPFVPPVPKNKSKRAVHQYSPDGYFIKSFDSITDAGLSVNLGKSVIWGCCHGLTNYAGGYRWFLEYQGNFINPIVPPPQKRLVDCFDLNMKFIKRYFSVVDFLNSMQFSESSTVYRKISKGLPFNNFYLKYVTDF